MYKKITRIRRTAVREAGVSQYLGYQIKGPHRPIEHIKKPWYQGVFRGPSSNISQHLAIGAFQGTLIEQITAPWYGGVFRGPSLGNLVSRGFKENITAPWYRGVLRGPSLGTLVSRGFRKNISAFWYRGA